MYVEKYRQSNRVREMKYAIRDLVVLANKLEKEGKKIIRLNIGDPLRYDYETPAEMIEAMYDASKNGKNYYADSLGELELREEISKHEKSKHGISTSADDVIFTSGVSEAIYFLLAAFTDVGEEILLPAPTYPAYSSLATVFQNNVKYYNCVEENNWLPDPDDIRLKISEKTRLMVLINPNNPTGAIYDEKVLREIRDIAGENNTVIVSDEIYDDLVLEGERPKGMASIAKDVPTIVFNGFSKSFLAPGWRAGYAYRWDPEDYIADAWEGMKKIARARLSATTPIEYGVLAGLRSERSYLAPLRKKLLSRRDAVAKVLEKSDLFSLVHPKAAFYAFPGIDISRTTFESDEDFVVSLLKEEGVLTVYGSGFGKSPVTKDHFRIVYLAPEEILTEAMEKTVNFAEKHIKN